MPHDTPTRRTRLPLLLLLLTSIGAIFGLGRLPAGDDRSEDSPPRGVPEGIIARYRDLSEAVRGEEMFDFMQVFHLNYIVEEREGGTIDRGPLRRRWLRLLDLYRYERMTFEPEQVLRREDGLIVVRTRRVAVREEERTGRRELHESYQEDTWVEEDGEWDILYRVEKEVVTAGTLPLAGEGELRSAALEELRRAAAAGKADSVPAFWAELRESGGPIVEPVPDAPHERWVTFVWQGGSGERRVDLGGVRSASKAEKPLERLDGTDVWYRTERLPDDARLTYAFHVEKAVRVPEYGEEPAETFAVSFTSPDPFNEKRFEGASIVELPRAPSRDWRKGADERPAGEVERHQVRSEVLGERRFVTVYTPPGFDADRSSYPAVFLLDNGDYDSRRATGEVLDALLARGAVPPSVVFMVHSEGSRSEGLEATPDLIRFLGEELLQWARDGFPLSAKPERTVIGGNGLGGGLAAWTAAEYPGTFGGVLAESGDFTACVDAGASGAPCIPRRFSETPKRPLRFHLVAGVYEGEPVLGSNRHLRDVLVAKGYDVTYREIPANHHSAAWWETLAGGLEALLGR